MSDFLGVFRTLDFSPLFLACFSGLLKNIYLLILKYRKRYIYSSIQSQND